MNYFRDDLTLAWKKRSISILFQNGRDIQTRIFWFLERYRVQRGVPIPLETTNFSLSVMSE